MGALSVFTTVLQMWMQGASWCYVPWTMCQLQARLHVWVPSWANARGTCGASNRRYTYLPFCIGYYLNVLFRETHYQKSTILVVVLLLIGIGLASLIITELTRWKSVTTVKEQVHVYILLVSIRYMLYTIHGINAWMTGIVTFRKPFQKDVPTSGCIKV